MRTASSFRLAALLLFISPLAALACSCVLKKPFSEKLPERANRSVAVLTAEVIRFDPVVVAPKSQTESSSRQSSACGFAVEVGKTYLVEAEFRPLNEPRWMVSSCSRTAQIGTATTDGNIRILHLWKAGNRLPGWITGRMFAYQDGSFQFSNLQSIVYILTADIPGTRNQVTIDLREQWSAGPVIFVGAPPQ